MDSMNSVQKHTSQITTKLRNVRTSMSTDTALKAQDASSYIVQASLQRAVPYLKKRRDQILFNVS